MSNRRLFKFCKNIFMRENYAQLKLNLTSVFFILDVQNQEIINVLIDNFLSFVRNIFERENYEEGLKL